MHFMHNTAVCIKSLYWATKPALPPPSDSTSNYIMIKHDYMEKMKNPRKVFCSSKKGNRTLYQTLKFLLQAGTGDEFLDELLSNDASLDEGGVPDIKVMDSSINMSGNEV